MLFSYRVMWFSYRATLLLAMAVVVSIIASWMPKRTPIKIDKGSYAQIRNGMTLAEVEAIIGAGPGAYTSCEYFVVDFNWKLEWAIPVRHLDWVGDKLAIRVTFDARGRVVWKDTLQVWLFKNGAIQEWS